MAVISQNFFYSAQNQYFMSKKKKEVRKTLEQQYWQLVEQYRAKKRQLNAFEMDQEAVFMALIKAADGLRDAYSLLAKNNTSGVSALLDKATLELKHLDVLKYGEQTQDLLPELEQQTVNTFFPMSVSEETVDIMPERKIIDHVESSNAILSTDVLISASRGLLMSGVLTNNEENISDSIEKVDVKQFDHIDDNETIEQESDQNFLTLDHDDFVPFVDLGDEKSKSTQDEKALFQLQALGNINISENPGMLRKSKIEETRRFFSRAKKQKIMSIRIGVLAARQQIENFFSTLGGRKIEFYLENGGVENDVLFWRVALSPKLMLYVVGLPNSHWEKNRERDLLLAELSFITLLTEKRAELTAEEDLAKNEIQDLCGSNKLRLRGPFHQ
ncbi:MAG: hypothetical protein GXP14_16530, partial [Gammaproteobacteria bacterium]|nr:hypothetical protein [Gammaproteobacteria bacterium]